MSKHGVFFSLFFPVFGLNDECRKNTGTNTGNNNTNTGKISRHFSCCEVQLMHQFFMEAVVQRCSVKKVFLKILQNSQANTCARGSFLIKLQACNFIKKESLAQVFSCEFCEIFKNIFFHRHLRWLLLSSFKLNDLLWYSRISRAYLKLFL